MNQFINQWLINMTVSLRLPRMKVVVNLETWASVSGTIMLFGFLNLLSLPSDILKYYLQGEECIGNIKYKTSFLFVLQKLADFPLTGIMLSALCIYLEMDAVHVLSNAWTKYPSWGVSEDHPKHSSKGFNLKSNWTIRNLCLWTVLSLSRSCLHQVSGWHYVWRRIMWTPLRPLNNIGLNYAQVYMQTFFSINTWSTTWSETGWIWGCGSTTAKG